MKKLSCYVVDDEKHAVDVLKHFISHFPYLRLIGATTDPRTALGELHQAELIFMDIDMPGINGLELSAQLMADQSLVFTTSHREYGPEAFERKAADYLLKPIKFERFVKCVSSIYEKQRALQIHTEHIFVKTGQHAVLTRLNLDEILYISGFVNYVEIHLAEERLITYLTLTELSEALPEHIFSRIHRSYIINDNAIRQIKVSSILLINGKELPIGRNFAANFRAKKGPLVITTKR